MYKITIKQKGDKFQDIIQEIEVTNRRVKRELKKIGTKALGKMRDSIDHNRLRKKRRERNLSPRDSSISLVKAINISHFSNGWGIGDINYLKHHAPHYLAQNYGSSHLVGKSIWGRFSDGKPRANKAGGRANFFPGRKPGGWMTVKTPIKPKNYIEKTNRFVNRAIDRAFSTLSRKG